MVGQYLWPIWQRKFVVARFKTPDNNSSHHGRILQAHQRVHQHQIRAGAQRGISPETRPPIIRRFRLLVYFMFILCLSVLSVTACVELQGRVRSEQGERRARSFVCLQPQPHFSMLQHVISSTSLHIIRYNCRHHTHSLIAQSFILAASCARWRTRTRARRAGN